MGSRYKIAFGIWTGAVLFVFAITATAAMEAPTCGGLSETPCPRLELLVMLAFGVALLGIWAVGALPFLAVYLAKRRRGPRYRDRS